MTAKVFDPGFLVAAPVDEAPGRALIQEPRRVPQESFPGFAISLGAEVGGRMQISRGAVLDDLQAPEVDLL